MSTNDNRNSNGRGSASSYGSDGSNGSHVNGNSNVNVNGNRLDLPAQRISFGIIGDGWRAAFYHEIARKLPQHFRVSAVYIRDSSKRTETEARWQTAVVESVEQLAACSDFVVLAVAKPAAAAWLLHLAERHIPVLAETPTAAGEEELAQLLPLAAQNPLIQVAEQYPLQPHQAARSAYIESGQLGSITHVEVSTAHGYHGVSLIRRWLGIEAAACEIIARRSTLPIADYSYRGHQPDYTKLQQEVQEVALLTFPQGKSAVLSFSRAQYFSSIRRNRVLIRGTHGEICNNSIIRQLAGGETEELEIRRLQGGQEGSLTPFSLRELRAGQQCLYINPFFPAAMSDEEIAIAQALQNMALFVSKGLPFYSLADALLDVRLALAIDTAAASTSSIQLT